MVVKNFPGIIVFCTDTTERKAARAAAAGNNDTDMTEYRCLPFDGGGGERSSRSGSHQVAGQSPSSRPSWSAGVTSCPSQRRFRRACQ